MAKRSIKISEEVPVKSRVYQIRLPKEPSIKLLEGRDVPCRLHPGPNKSFYVSGVSLKYLKSKNYSVKIIREIIPHEKGLKIIYPLDMILHRLPADEVQAEIIAHALSQKKGGKFPIPVYYGRTHIDIPGTFRLDRPGGQRRYLWRWDRRGRKRPTRQFKDLFPKFVRRIKDPETRFVVSLGGGGLRLFAHPSIFKLIEELGAKDSIEEVWGCSGGAIAGLAYSLGADHEILENEGYRIYHNKFGSEFVPRRMISLRQMIFSRFLPKESMGLKGFVDIQTSLQESLKRIAKHRRTSIPFFAIAYNVSLHKNEVLTPEKISSETYNGLIKHASPIDAMLASTAIPILFVPRIIKRGRTPITYIDGGVSEELPLLSIHRKWEIDKEKGLTKTKRLFILTVNLFPQLASWRILKSRIIKYLPMIDHLSVITRIADLIRESRIDEQVKQIRQDPNATVVQITLGPMQKSAFLDPNIIPEVIDKAKGTFFQQLRNIERRL